MVVYGFAKEKISQLTFLLLRKQFSSWKPTRHMNSIGVVLVVPFLNEMSPIFSGNVSMSFGSWNASFNTIAIVGFHYHALCVTFIMKWGPNILPRTHLLLLFNAVDWILKKAGVLEKKLETHRSPCWILNLRKIKVKLFYLPANVCFCISGKEDSNVNSFRTFFIFSPSFTNIYLSVYLVV